MAPTQDQVQMKAKPSKVWIQMKVRPGQDRVQMRSEERRVGKE